MSCAEEQEAIVKESLLKFLQDNFPQSKLSHIDEIVLSYVVSILEELGSEWGQEELFDVESFSEMLTAYFPDFESIPHASICDWIFNLSAELSKATKDTRDSKVSPESGLKFAIPIVTKSEGHLSRVSESSDGSTSGESSHSSTQEFDRNEDARLLIEMFPLISLTEAVHCLSLSNGSVEEAVLLVLHRQEIGQSLSNTENPSLLQHKTRPVNETTLKKKIIEKYSYIDQDDDQREHRPPPLKAQPKKMVRYLDNKVVTIKGERYTEIKEDADAKEEAKKTYVSLKPARQYRFH